MWQRKLLPKTSRRPALEGFYRGRAESLVSELLISASEGTRVAERN